MNCLTKFFTRVSLIKQIIIGLIIGIAVAVVFPAAGKELSLLGILFVGALKGIAPVLVFVLVASALSRKQAGHDSNIESENDRFTAILSHSYLIRQKIVKNFKQKSCQYLSWL